VPTTPDEWLPVLTKRLDARLPSIRKARDYANGRAPLPEMGAHTRASWEAFQRKARTNYGGLAVGSLGDRIRPNGIVVGDDATSEASARARRIWRNNRLDLQVASFVEDYLTTGVGYLVEGVGPDGSAIITREEPELFYAATDPLRPWKARATVKVWTDADAERDYALVWVNGARQRYSRPTDVPVGDRNVLVQAIGERWVRDAEPEIYDGDPPVVIAERESGKGVLEDHFDVIDRINLGKLNRLVIVAMQAFRQRALKTAPGTAGLPEKDESGNVIDWTKVFSPAPGALWDLPEGIDVWESQTTEIIPLLEGEKADARDFAAVTRTPISVFIPDGANQSAEGAANATAGQVSQAESEIARIQPALAAAIVIGLRIEGVDLADQTVEVSFQPPAYVSIAEKYAAAAQAKAAGEPWKSIARNILGYSPEQIAQAELDRADEQLTAAALFAQTPAQPAQQASGGAAAVA
jgi:hypothetical protein